MDRAALPQAWTVRDVMVEDVVTVTLDTPFKQLVELLWLRDVSGLPVVDAGRLVGIVSESDLIVREEHDPANEPVLAPLKARDLMTEPVVTIRPQATLAEAAKVMRERRLKRLPVVDEAGALVGIVSRADLLKVFLRSEETIQLDVRELILRFAHNPEAISTQVADGVVVISGEAASHEEAERLLRAIDALPGVTGVENRLAEPAAR